MNPGTARQLRREMPDDFAEMRAKLGGRDVLAAHYRTSTRTIRRWLQEAELPPLHVVPSGRGCRPVPDDFAESAARMCQADLCRYYGASREVVVRWIGESGVTPKKFTPTPWVPTRNSIVKIAAVRNYGIQDEAADTLRRWFPVYRCDERGRQSEKGEYWRVGNSVVDGDELLASASRRRAA